MGFVVQWLKQLLQKQTNTNSYQGHNKASIMVYKI